jgi:hypothetical protein
MRNYIPIGRAFASRAPAAAAGALHICFFLYAIAFYQPDAATRGARSACTLREMKSKNVSNESWLIAEQFQRFVYMCSA